MLTCRAVPRCRQYHAGLSAVSPRQLSWLLHSMLRLLLCCGAEAVAAALLPGTPYCDPEPASPPAADANAGHVPGAAADPAAAPQQSQLRPGQWGPGQAPSEQPPQHHDRFQSLFAAPSTQMPSTQVPCSQAPTTQAYGATQQHGGGAPMASHPDANGRREAANDWGSGGGGNERGATTEALARLAEGVEPGRRPYAWATEANDVSGSSAQRSSFEATWRAAGT